MSLFQSFVLEPVERIRNLFFFIFASVLHWWGKHWIMLNRTHGGPVVYPETGNKHKVVVIGDEYGLGFGDKIVYGTNPGICRTLAGKYQDYKPVKIRTQWFFHNRAHFASTTRNWLPDTESVPLFKSGSVSKNLFHDLFESSRVADCSMVLIMFGYADNIVFQKENGLQAYETDELVEDETLDNIHQIATSLAQMGKMVFVSQFPINKSLRSHGHRHELRNRIRNKVLQLANTRALETLREADEEVEVDENHQTENSGSSSSQQASTEEDEATAVFCQQYIKKFTFANRLQTVSSNFNSSIFLFSGTHHLLKSSRSCLKRQMCFWDRMSKIRN
eukprot:TRINITY_DN1147_c0_g3_i1.p1 TRINITY_DN1147_c0_g3~~TRINITY_DN1147_c0_g3_i1.p1  ORF type:complete len:333 (+),score=77.81 TRINITY_DN1147_c0_g3_i1:1095-2093(+)